MGGASAIGLGLALAQPTQSVVVITGDGEQLMGIGSLATIGCWRRPKTEPLLRVVPTQN
jgi:thiamine pyrophosphate-dependent acetolactate synthase large subunit-like protein